MSIPCHCFILIIAGDCYIELESWILSFHQGYWSKVSRRCINVGCKQCSCFDSMPFLFFESAQINWLVSWFSLGSVIAGFIIVCSDHFQAFISYMQESNGLYLISLNSKYHRIEEWVFMVDICVYPFFSLHIWYVNSRYTFITCNP